MSTRAERAGGDGAGVLGYLGLDVSQDEVVACLLLPDGREATPRWRVANTQSGAEALARRLAELARQYHLERVRIGLEATNLYWWHLACLLKDTPLLASLQREVYALNPKLVAGLKKQLDASQNSVAKYQRLLRERRGPEAGALYRQQVLPLVNKHLADGLRERLRQQAERRERVVSKVQWWAEATFYLVLACAALTFVLFALWAERFATFAIGDERMDSIQVGRLCVGREAFAHAHLQRIPQKGRRMLSLGERGQNRAGSPGVS